MSDEYNTIGIPIATEEEAKAKFKETRAALLEATVKCFENPTEENKAALAAAKQAFSRASMYTHD